MVCLPATECEVAHTSVLLSPGCANFLDARCSFLTRGTSGWQANIQIAPGDGFAELPIWLATARRRKQSSAPLPDGLMPRIRGRTYCVGGLRRRSSGVPNLRHPPQLNSAWGDERGHCRMAPRSRATAK